MNEKPDFSKYGNKAATAPAAPETSFAIFGASPGNRRPVRQTRPNARFSATYLSRA